MTTFTQEQAEFIAKLIGYADGGCSTCVGNLIDAFNSRETGWTLVASGHEDYDYELDEVLPDGWPNKARIAVLANPTPPPR